MLSNQATDFVLQLLKEYGSNTYVVVETELLIELAGEGKDFDALWHELQFNKFVEVKYNDGEEICFRLTDTARLLEQDLQVVNNMRGESTLVQVDELGRPVLVMPKEDAEKTTRKYTVPSKSKNAMIVFLSFLFGCIGGCVTYFVINLIGG